MSILHQKFGKTTIAKVSNSDELRQMLVDPWLQSETIIIKPNWASTEPGCFSNSKSLRTLFEALDSHLIVTESYMISRSFNLLKEGKTFIVGDKEVNWKWLQKGKGWNWLIENPNWNWFKRDGHWDHIKKEDRAFLDEYGFTDLFKEFNVSYVNVTEEVWSGRIADPTEIKRSVESRFKPVHIEKLYSMVPKKLYDLRGSTLISFAKLRQVSSFTIKNLFGMIPDPTRQWWHGPNDYWIGTSVLDINKIYNSLFNVYGICEALSTTPVSHPEGKFEGLYGGKYNIEENLGVVAFSRHPASLDAILLNLTEGSIVVDEKVTRGPIIMAEEEFGTYDRETLKELRSARAKVRNWLSFKSY